MFDWNALEDRVALTEKEAIEAGDRARLLLTLEEGAEDPARRTIRRRLASSLVQLGVKLDPLAAEDLEAAG